MVHAAVGARWRLGQLEYVVEEWASLADEIVCVAQVGAPAALLFGYLSDSVNRRNLLFVAVLLGACGAQVAPCAGQLASAIWCLSGLEQLEGGVAWWCTFAKSGQGPAQEGHMVTRNAPGAPSNSQARALAS